MPRRSGRSGSRTQVAGAPPGRPGPGPSSSGGRGSSSAPPGRRAAGRTRAADAAPPRPPPAPGEARHQGDDRRPLGRGHQPGEDDDLVRGGLGEVAVDAEHVARALDRCTDRAASTDGRNGGGYSNVVTTPKLPPPPRSPQNRSAVIGPSARTRRPSAVTHVSADQVVARESVRPMSQPMPPPSVSPAMPVGERCPSSSRGRALSWLRRSRASVQPPSRARDAFVASTSMRFIGERSMTSPPSHVRLAGGAVSAAAHRDDQTCSARS